MGVLRVSVTVEGGEDIAALVQDHLEQNLRFRTVGPTCRQCKEQEALSDAGQEFQAPPVHPHCNCILVVENDESSNEEPI